MFRKMGRESRGKSRPCKTLESARRQKRSAFVVMVDQDKAFKPAQERKRADAQVRDEAPDNLHLGRSQGAFIRCGIGLHGKQEAQAAEVLLKLTGSENIMRAPCLAHRMSRDNTGC